MQIRNMQYAALVNARLCTDAQYAIRNTQPHSNSLFSGCSQQVLCVSSAHTQYAIRNAQSCSRQDCVNTQQGASVRRQSIRSVNRIAHVSESTADDHLTVDGEMFVVGADPEHAAGPSLSAADHQTVNGGTQWMVLSAAIDKRCLAEGLWGTSSMLEVRL